MRQNVQPKQHRSAPKTHRIRNWLIAGIIALIILMVTVPLMVPYFINYAPIKQRIQDAVTEHIAGRLDFQALDFFFLPRPAIELRKVTLALPDQKVWTAAALRVSPEILPLLTGDLRLALLELDSPQLHLEESDLKSKKFPAEFFTLSAIERNLTKALASVGQRVDNSTITIANAQIIIIQGKEKRIQIENLNLQLRLHVTNPQTAQANLEVKLSKLNINRNNHQETLRGISLNGSIQMMNGRLTAKLDRLSVAEPALALNGELISVANTPAITMNLSGSNLDVEPIRKTILSLAGNTFLTRAIFDYLHGGLVPKISFTSQGKSLSDLGDLKNLRIEGHLQDGKISIPDLNLNLSEVIGDVIISEGILQGRQLSTHLEGSTGKEGSLKIGLTEDNDLFQLKLKVNAELEDIPPILKRVVDSPPFIAELEKISNLQGKATGWLTLGDSLNDIGTKVDIGDLRLSANYLRLPSPIKISAGHFTYSGDKIILDSLDGTLGQSNFADLSCQLLWENNLFLKISSARLGLNMTQLYPWLHSQKRIGEMLSQVDQVTGQLSLSSLKFKGEIDKPSGWQFHSTGSTKNLSVAASFFPDAILLKSGEFKIDPHSLTFEKLTTVGLDTALTLTGNLKGSPQQISSVNITLDGRVGPQSVTWLSDTFDVPAVYAIHAPLSLNSMLVSRQPDSTTSFKGTVSIDEGPVVTVDIDHLPKELQVHRLTVKDQYSDAEVALDLRKDQRDFSFTGKLQHETLQALFVDPQFSSGRLEGEFAVNVSQIDHLIVKTKGQLRGENLPLLFYSGDKVNIEQVTLRADGPRLKVDISKLTWKGLVWAPVKATVSFDTRKTDISFAEAKLCGIDSTGLLSITDNGFFLDITLEGKNFDVATSYTCLTDGQSRMTGSLDFESHITGKGQMNEMIRSLAGPLEMTFNNGVIEQDKILARVLEVLNVTEIVKGRLPNLAGKSLPYKTMTLQGEFRNGNLIINKYFMDGETLNLVGSGEIHLDNKTVDVQLLAAPLQTIDTIVRNIPGINYLLGGSLVTIPVNITGDLANPEVNILPVSAVGTSLYNLAKRTIKSPFKLIEKITPWGNDNNE